MNKVYQYISDYRLPTEKPFKDAVRLYWQRVLIICAVALSAMAASVLIALIIITFQAGYGFIVIIVVFLILSSLGGGGTSGGTSGGGQTPPPKTTNTGRQPEEPQATQTDTEKVLVPARPSPRKQKMLALRIDDPTEPPTVIEIEVDKYD